MNEIEVKNKIIEGYFPFKKFRPYQKRILYDIVNSLESDKDLIILEGPTGFGKSPVNIALGKYFKPSFYTTPQVKLVNQIARDFCPRNLVIDGGIGDVVALLGRKNYICRESHQASDICPIRDGLEGIDDNGNEVIRTCTKEHNCTYWKQKEQAMESDIAVLTFAMLITNTYLSGESHFSARNLLIIDECHSLESQIAGMFAGFTLSSSTLPKFKPEEQVYQEEMNEELEKDLPRSGRIKDYLPFFNKFERFTQKWLPLCANERERDKLTNLSRKIDYMLLEIDEGRKWVIDIPKYKNYSKKLGPRKFKPILVDKFLQRKVWSQSNKIILSSATIPFRDNIHAWLKRIGLEEMKYEFYSVPMSFPLWNRQIITSCMGGKMTRKEENKNWEGNVNIIKEIIKKHDGERGVIHTQSYKRARRLYYELNASNTFLHDKGELEGDLIEEWIKTNKMVLISPSIKEGVDLKGELCRFQILLKVPYPNIKDSRVEYLLNKKKDWKWYNNEAIKYIVQMYGRAVRSSNDYAKFYIIDGSFNNLSRKGFPQWFLDAIVDSKERFQRNDNLKLRDFF